MADVALAFLWHQHQPYYRDDVAGEAPLPWARLHGVRDCYGLPLLLSECPELRCTINLSPCLLVQILAYAEGGASDRFLDLSRRPADGLGEADALFLLDHFFMANPERMILPQPRYAELFHRRDSDQLPARQALPRFTEADLRDLQVWFNLAWVHPLAVERDELLRGLRDKGRDFSEADKAEVLNRQLELLAEVIPLHRRLAESGQVELTTSPFYHPILPLLLDKRLALEAVPDLRLPRHAAGYPEDADAQVRRAVELHVRLFGRPPRGLWPPEGAVCAALPGLLRKHGVRWLATDESVLRGALAAAEGRTDRNLWLGPDRLYRPYLVGEPGTDLAVVFRDHVLSDLIAFQYPLSDPRQAADGFVGRLRGLGGAVQGPEPALVCVVLDGEACWEQYPHGGADFLRALGERCGRTPGLRAVAVGEHLERHPPRRTLPRLFAGSWIDGDLAMWVGHEEDNAAWDALERTRDHLLTRQQRWRADAAAQGAAAPPRHLQRRLDRAWEEIYVAEGGDWFWRYADDKGRPEDAVFDELFRKHLQNVYLLLGDVPPAELARPLRRRCRKPLFTPPRALLDVRIDGRYTFFEWVGAGYYSCRDEKAALPARGPLREVHFGFDARRLLVRIDCDGPARAALSAADAVRLVFLEPAGHEVRLERPGRPDQTVRLDGRSPADAAGLEGAIDRIAELAVPFDLLGVPVGGPVRFVVEVLRGGQGIDRAPREAALALHRPAADFERVMWDV